MKALAAMIALALATPAHAAPPQLTVTWVDHTDGAAWTALERDAGQGFRLVSQNKPGVTEYVDRDVRRRRPYCYRAFAYLDAVRHSDYSETACGVAR